MVDPDAMGRRRAGIPQRLVQFHQVQTSRKWLVCFTGCAESSGNKRCRCQQNAWPRIAEAEIHLQFLAICWRLAQCEQHTGKRPTGLWEQNIQPKTAAQPCKVNCVRVLSCGAGRSDPAASPPRALKCVHAVPASLNDKCSPGWLTGGDSSLSPCAPSLLWDEPAGAVVLSEPATHPSRAGL